MRKVTQAQRKRGCGISKVHKFVRQSPIVVLEALIHGFSLWILVAAMRLFSLLAAPPESLDQMLAYHANTYTYCKHLILSLLLLIGFSFALCRCARDVSICK